MAGYVSEALIRRLPSYYRHLQALEKEGIVQISSTDLGRRMQLNPSQIRQDINSFGGIGRQGYGYPVRELLDQIRRVLGLQLEHRMVILGAGRIGRAVADYSDFALEGFVTVALFDSDPKRRRPTGSGISVYGMDQLEQLLPGMFVSVAVLAVPAEAAQDTLERLYALGVRAFWNFAPVELKVPRDAVVENVRLSDSLYMLGYRMQHPDSP